MQDLGPAMPDVDCIIQQDSGQWCIHWNDGLRVDVSRCDQPMRLMLSALIAVPGAQSLSDVHTTMRCVDLIVAEDPTLRVALTRPGGDLMLISEWVPDQCALADFRDTLLRHAERARYFSALISPALARCDGCDGCDDQGS